MTNYNFKKRNLFSGPHLLGLLFVIAGIFALVSPFVFESQSSFERSLFVGMAALIIGIMILSSYSGVLVDFSAHRAKEYICLLGFKIGEWADLPGINTIKVLEVSQRTSNTPNGISPTLTGRVTLYKTFLYADDSKPVLSFDYSRRERALKDAEHLATYLDATLKVAFKE